MSKLTKEMVKNGLRKGVITLEDEFEGCISLCYRICDHAFYFAGMEDENLTAAEYNKLYSEDEMVDHLWRILQDEDSACRNGLDEIEYKYYTLILSSRCASPEKNYVVNIAVNGRISISVDAENFEEARKKACTEICDADFGNLECIDWHAVNATDEKGNSVDY